MGGQAESSSCTVVTVDAQLCFEKIYSFKVTFRHLELLRTDGVLRILTQQDETVLSFKMPFHFFLKLQLG